MKKGRLILLVVVLLLIAGNIVGWSLFFSNKGDEQGIVQLRDKNNSLTLRVAELEKVNSILYANVKETDGWLQGRDKLIRSLAIQLPTAIVVDEVASLASVSKDETEARQKLYILGKIFQVEKDPLSLTSQEVKIREIGEKIRQKEVGISVK